MLAYLCPPPLSYFISIVRGVFSLISRFVLFVCNVAKVLGLRYGTLCLLTISCLKVGVIHGLSVLWILIILVGKIRWMAEFNSRLKEDAKSETDFF